MLDTFVVKDRFGLDVICKVLATFELENEVNKYIAYTDYIYDNNLKYNVYFSEVVTANNSFVLRDIEDDNLAKELEMMYEEGVKDGHDVQ
jgi:hypothetical protein